jgi:hypothetical protein
VVRLGVPQLNVRRRQAAHSSRCLLLSTLRATKLSANLVPIPAGRYGAMVCTGGTTYSIAAQFLVSVVPTPAI